MERVFHSVENFKKMRKTLDSLSSNPFFDKVHESPREKKQSIIQVAERKF